MREAADRPYNRPLPDSILKTAGKAALIVVGAGYGLFRGLRAVGRAEARAVRLDGLTTRLEAVERAVDQVSAGRSREESKPDWVTAEEMAAAIDTATTRINSGLDRKFEAQSRAVSSLRAMISQTDILLQRVLDGLESAEADAELAERSGR